MHRSRSNRLKAGSALAALLALAVAGTAFAATGPAKLYTKAQAVKGQQVFAHNCVACHGGNEQGKSGPAIAGKAFLKRAKLLGWSVEDMRHVVVSTMPRNNPGSLSDQQYANVLAYLLASDCYPAGQTPFPTKETPKLKNTKLQMPANAKPDNPKTDTCNLHPKG